MMALIKPEQLKAIIYRVDPGCVLQHAQPLTGGISAGMMALRVKRPDESEQKLLLRWHGAMDSDERPHKVVQEYHLLKRLKAAGLPVSTPLSLDQSGEILNTSYLVLDYIDGATNFALAHGPVHAREAAATLARIHQVPVEDGLRDHAAICESIVRKRPAQLDESLNEGRIREVLDAAWPWESRNESVLMHGDFWPGNILWVGDRLAGVIDWEDAALGDPLADLGIARLETLWAYGREAMAMFTQVYLAAMPDVDCRTLPYWDLVAALRPMGQLAAWAPGWAAYGRSDVSAATMGAAHRWFTAWALEQCE